MPQFLNFMIARQVKAAIWTGARYSEIASHFGVSQPTISNIALGKTWAEIPWPDHSTGALPMEQKTAIQAMRYKGTGVAFAPNVAASYIPSHPGSAGSKLDPRAIEAEYDRQQMIRDTEAMKAIMEPEDPAVVAERRRAESERERYEAEHPSEVKLDEDFWEMLVAKHATNPFVEAAMGGSLEAKMAVVSAFQALPEEQWTSDNADRYVKAALRLLVPNS